MEIATLGGGCFWCTEAIFKRLKGVKSVVSGYAGSKQNSAPTYEKVATGLTGYAESIQVQFDSLIISYEKLLEVFFATHDPSTKNRQGNDIGAQYRSIIFYHDTSQKKIAEKLKKKSDVTEIVPFDKFYKAEEYHQNYYDKNKSLPYCQYVINPKLKNLLSEFSKEVVEDFKKDSKI
jgi:peptide-methionine (S)-S-oxide reductase